MKNRNRLRVRKARKEDRHRKSVGKDKSVAPSSLLFSSYFTTLSLTPASSSDSRIATMLTPHFSFYLGPFHSPLRFLFSPNLPSGFPSCKNRIRKSVSIALASKQMFKRAHAARAVVATLRRAKSIQAAKVESRHKRVELNIRKSCSLRIFFSEGR